MRRRLVVIPEQRPRLGLDDLKALSRTPLAEYLPAAPGIDLIRLKFEAD